MTLKEFREATKNVDENAILMINANGNPLWYFVERPRSGDDANSLFLMDKSGIDLNSEIEAALYALGKPEAIKYLLKNGVTLDELKNYSEELYTSAKDLLEGKKLWRQDMQ